MKLLDISEVSKQTGIAASTLRYYEDQGLIETAGRRGLKRLFEPDIVLRLAFISLGKAAGFSLEEIASMAGRGGRPAVSREALHQRADTLDAQIRQMTHLRDAIRHVADCPHPSHMECPKFRRLLQLGARRRPPRKKLAARQDKT